MNRLNQIIMLQQTSASPCDLGQLFEVKEQLMHMMGAGKNRSEPCLTEIYSQISSNIDEQPLQQKICHLIDTGINQLRQLFAQEQANKIALAQLSIKLIDYIAEMGHEQEQRIEKYERDIYELRGEVEYLGNRNVCVQGDVQIFREQLRIAQEEIEEIGKYEDKEPLGLNRCKDGKCEKVVGELEAEIQRLRQQLTALKMSQPSKISLLSSPSSKINHLQQNDQLVIRIQQLQEENIELKQKLKQFSQTIPKEDHIEQSKFQSNCENDRKSLYSSNHKMTLAGCESFRKLINEPSVQQFRQLNHDCSSRYFDASVSEGFCFNLNQSQKSFGFQLLQQPETRETQHSDQELQIQSVMEDKSVCTEPTNIINPQKEQQEQCLCRSIKGSFQTILSQYRNLQSKYVQNRIRNRMRR